MRCRREGRGLRGGGTDGQGEVILRAAESLDFPICSILTCASSAHAPCAAGGRVLLQNVFPELMVNCALSTDCAVSCSLNVFSVDQISLWREEKRKTRRSLISSPETSHEPFLRSLRPPLHRHYHRCCNKTASRIKRNEVHVLQNSGNSCVWWIGFVTFVGPS